MNLGSGLSDQGIHCPLIASLAVAESAFPFSSAD